MEIRDDSVITPGILLEKIEANGGPEGLDVAGRTIIGVFDDWDLSGCNFRGANLTGCRFRGTRFRRSDFRGCDLSGVNLSFAYLRGAVLRSADLPRATLWKANLIGADLSDADCQDSIFEQAKLRRAKLRDCSLQGSNFEKSDMRRVDLWNANLQGANLAESVLRGSNLRNTNLLNANLEGADLRRADISDANLQNANLEDADLRDANLTISNLMNANLEETKLRDCRLDDTNLEGVNWGSSGVLASLKEGDYATSARIHRSLRMWYQQSGDHEMAGDYYYWEMNARRLAAWWGDQKGEQARRWWPDQPLTFLALTLMWGLAGYGERPLMVLISVSLLVALPALIYWGFRAFPGQTIVDSLYFSAASTSALGYGSWVRPEPVLWARIGGVIQTFIGVPILALFLVTFTRRLIR